MNLLNILNAVYPVGLPIALSLTAYNSFLTGLIVFLKRRDRAGLHYFIASFNIFLWGMGISFMLNNDLPISVAHLWGNFSQIVALFIPLTWFRFVLTYTGEEARYQKLTWLISAITIAIFPFTFTSHFVAGYREMVQVHSYPIPGPAYAAFTILFIVVVSFSFWVFFRAIKNATHEKKKDLRWVCYASLYGFGTGSLSLLAVFGVPFTQYNLLLMPLWQILLAYAMIKYRMFDLEQLAEAAQKDKLAAIGTLATSINHEIRNPLYVIQGLAESHLVNLNENIYLNEKHAFEKANEILKKTAEQATRAMEIMKSFAIFAKQQVSQHPTPNLVDVSKILDGVLPLISHQLELDKIELRCEISPNAREVQVDPRHLEEILFNLVVNSCQAMKNGGSIEISAERQNDHVNLFINDSGPGIPPHQLKRIFEPFYTTKEEGTGLGLHITKQLVERNGGKIRVKSKLGEGTKFTLTLPAK
jgi:signal transduction histidine kinase